MANVVLTTTTNPNNAVITTVHVDDSYSLEFKTPTTPTQEEIDSYVQKHKDQVEERKKEQEMIQQALEDRYLTLEERNLKYG